MSEDKSKEIVETSENDISESSEAKKNKKGNIFFDWVVPIAIAIVIALLIKRFLIFKVYIPSASMVPTLNEGDHLFVTRVYNLHNLKRGDIIVFDSDELNDVLIKRLIGLPGDKIKIVSGKVYVNGEELKEDYVKNGDNVSGEYEVPEGKYFFLGDNRAVSYDSRKWINHYIDGSDIKAKAQLKVYPFSDFGFVS
ncbi:MAG: signal peptidase I [Clostridium sp.]|nr:signal peptidase I [Clostridium sp.]